jgi:hypothetical protein
LLIAAQLMHGSEMLGAPTRDTMGTYDPSERVVPRHPNTVPRHRIPAYDTNGFSTGMRGTPACGAVCLPPARLMSADIIEREVPWRNKTDSRLFFRGGPTGEYCLITCASTIRASSHDRGSGRGLAAINRASKRGRVQLFELNNPHRVHHSCCTVQAPEHSSGRMRQAALPPSRVLPPGPLTGPGIFHTSARWDWRSSQRDRLALFAKDRHARAHDDPLLVDRGVGQGGVVIREMWDHDQLVGRYLDVGLVPKVGGSLYFRSLRQPSAGTRDSYAPSWHGHVLVRSIKRLCPFAVIL